MPNLQHHPQWPIQDSLISKTMGFKKGTMGFKKPYKSSCFTCVYSRSQQINTVASSGIFLHCNTGKMVSKADSAIKFIMLWDAWRYHVVQNEALIVICIEKGIRGC